MHARAGVGMSRQDVFRGTAGLPAHERPAAALRGPKLEPINGVAVNGEFGKDDGRSGNELGPYRRIPGAVRLLALSVHASVDRKKCGGVASGTGLPCPALNPDVMPSLRSLLACALVFVFCAAPVAGVPQEASEAVAVTHTTLANGMQIYVLPNRLSPVVSMYTNYLAGANDRADDRSRARSGTYDVPRQ